GGSWPTAGRGSTPSSTAAGARCPTRAGRTRSASASPPAPPLRAAAAARPNFRKATFTKPTFMNVAFLKFGSLNPGGRPATTMGVVHDPLTADCSRCAGLCCVALPFAASADFAVDKAAGTPCGHLQPDFRCGIHDGLREAGYPGCTVFDCFGAGQRVVQVTFG